MALSPGYRTVQISDLVSVLIQVLDKSTRLQKGFKTPSEVSFLYVDFMQSNIPCIPIVYKYYCPCPLVFSYIFSQ